MTQLIFIRHAQTIANVERRWVGWGQTGLTELGWTQVDALARRLTAENLTGATLYSSPLQRALETARGVGRPLGLVPIPVDGLREVNFGDLDGITLEEMAEQHPALFARWQNKEDSNYAWPGGDRRADFFRRVAATCDTILSRHDRGTVIIVGHGGTLRAVLAHLLPERMGQWWSYSIDNCSLTRIEVKSSGAHLIVLNDTAHLQAIETTE